MMKTDNIITALGEFSSVSEAPVSLIRHSARRLAARDRAEARAAGAKVVPLRYPQHAACSV